MREVCQPAPALMIGDMFPLRLLSLWPLLSTAPASCIRVCFITRLPRRLTLCKVTSWERAIPPTISMSTGDPHNPLFTISGLYPPFTSPLMSRAKPFESPASAASAAGLFPGLGPVPGLLPPHHLNPLLSSHLQAQAAHQGHFGLPHPFFPPTSASPGDRGPGGQKSPILARAGAGGHTGKL